MFIKEIVYKILLTIHPDYYIRHLRKKGVVIGDNVSIYSPLETTIDTQKPWLIKIGDYCKITKGVTILAHDYSVSVCRRVFGEFVGGSLPVNIGNNVFIGVNSTILMGTTIGDNCIIGANSVVKGVFAPNSVIAGNPARVICSIEELHKKIEINGLTMQKNVLEQFMKIQEHFLV